MYIEKLSIEPSVVLLNTALTSDLSHLKPGEGPWPPARDSIVHTSDKRLSQNESIDDKRVLHERVEEACCCESTRKSY